MSAYFLGEPAQLGLLGVKSIHGGFGSIAGNHEGVRRVNEIELFALNGNGAEKYTAAKFKVRRDLNKYAAICRHPVAPSTATGVELLKTHKILVNSRLAA